MEGGARGTSEMISSDGPTNRQSAAPTSLRRGFRLRGVRIDHEESVVMTRLALDGDVRDMHRLVV